MASSDAQRLPTRPNKGSVSVVVLSKDEPELAHTLDVLAPQCAALGAECLVVDASAGRLDHIRQARPWVRWIDFVVPFAAQSSIPQQRNVGVRAAAGEVIAFCDAGGTPSEGWLAALTGPIVAGELHVTCGPLTSVRPGVYRTMNDAPDGEVVESVPTANLAFSRAAFDAVGGFDERYAYGSDHDFAWRLLKVGMPPISVRAAVMGMDWGPWALQKKRSWRYGRARARLFRFHPDRRRRILTSQPEITVYPALVLAFPVVVGLAMIGVWLAAVLWTALVGLLRFRNRKAEQPWAVLLSHVIYSSAFFAELAASLVRRLPAVVETPRDEGPYHDHLVPALADAGVSTFYLDGPTRSASANLLLAPAYAFWLRARGVRIYHLHWTYKYQLPWAGSKFARRLCRAWFGLHLRALKAAGIRLVWTAHNVVPHDPVFDNDERARRTLVKHADAVIAHNEVTATELARRFGASDVEVIAQGSTPLPPADREASRALLGVTDRFLLAAVCRVTTYKGFDDLLEALPQLPADERERLAVVVAGECADEELAARLHTLADAARKAGVEVRLDLRRLSDQELAGVLAAADAAVFPFRSITNSGSVVLALSAGVPCLVADLPVLSSLPDDAVLRHAPGTTGIATSISELLELDKDDLTAMGLVASLWAEEHDWAQTARATRALFERILEGGRR